MEPNHELLRRSFLGSASAALIGLAGCTTAENPTANTATRGGNASTDTATAQPANTPTGTATETEPSQPEGDPDSWKGLETDQSLDTFDAVAEQWSVVSGAATVSEEIAYDETAIRLDTEGSNRVRIKRSFDSSQDFRGAGFSMAVRLEDTTANNLEVGLIIEDLFGNTRLYSGSVRPTATDRWVRLDLGVKDDDGIDKQAIREIEINLWDGDDVSRFYVDDIRMHPLPKTGYVMFTFDDAAAEDYSVAFPTLEEYGYQGACFPTANHVHKNSVPSVSDYLEMQDHGWDIGGHTLQHNNLAHYSREEQRLILEKNKAWLEDNGFTHGARFFRTPYGAYDSNSLDLLPEFFEMSFVGAGSAKGVNFAVTDPRTVGMKNGDDFERAQSLVDAAVQYKHLLGLTIHLGAMSDRAAFENLIAHAAEHEQQGRLKIITPSTLLDDHIQG